MNPDLKTIFFSMILLLSIHQVSAMNSTTQAIAVVSAASVLNTASAVYMQQHGLNPQLISNSNGSVTVVSSSEASSNNYLDQNQQENKQAFFNE